ncbi:MAG: hypothetical protein ACREQM_04895, partial [Candidatus Dormibacteraceae bacterium]
MQDQRGAAVKETALRTDPPPPPRQNREGIWEWEGQVFVDGRWVDKAVRAKYVDAGVSPSTTPSSFPDTPAPTRAPAPEGPAWMQGAPSAPATKPDSLVPARDPSTPVLAGRLQSWWDSGNSRSGKPGDWPSAEERAARQRERRRRWVGRGLTALAVLGLALIGLTVV